MLATIAAQPFPPWTIFWPAIAGTVVLGSVMINSKAIPQAERNADGLAQFIKASAGETVTVEPIVVLPGWLVEGEKASPRALVLNPKRIPKYLENRAPGIAPDQVQRIRFQIDQKCRDVEFW
jgi:hypothetical protein